MPVFNRKDLKVAPFEPEYCAATGSEVRGEQIAAHFLLYPSGSEIKPHIHAREQIAAIVKGKATYVVGGEEKTVNTGEAVLIRRNTEYSAKVLEDLEVVQFEYVGSPKVQPEIGTSSAFFKWDEMEADFITPKYSPAHGPNIKGDYIEVGLFSYPAGGRGNRHSHPNEQIQVLLKGLSEGIIGEEKFTQGPGSVVLMPTYMEHEAVVIEDYTTINCKNIVEGWSVHDAQWVK
jgi:quercetin dioxygenase-like cupin family protein